MSNRNVGNCEVQAPLPTRRHEPAPSPRPTAAQALPGVSQALPGVSQALPGVSALICTYGRGAKVVGAVQSILHAHSTCQELIVVDQSTDDSTEIALAPFRHDPRFHYQRSQTQGKGAALNLGLTLAQHPIVAITDDDCIVDAHWPQCHAEIFHAYPHVALTYGTVLPVAYDAAAGFIPTYAVPRDQHCTTFWQKRNARGIGANTAVRREAILQLGGFDPELCPGGRFHACVDRDLTLRCLLQGHEVYEIKKSVVHHDGFRNWAQGQLLARNAFYALGAAHVKALRCGRWEALGLLLWELGVYALAPSILATVQRRRPKGWNRVIYFIRGIVDGLRCPINRRHMLYQNTAEQHERQLHTKVN